MKFTICISILLLVTISSCQNESTTRTPEETVRTWQAFVDENNLEAAKTLSTTPTQQMLDNIAKAFGDEPIKVKTQFIEIFCTEEKDKAICRCKFRQDTLSESYEDIFILKKVQKQWLIDINQDEINTEDMLIPEMAGDAIKK